MQVIARVKTMAVLPDSEPLFSERCTDVMIVDEAGGEFIEVSQHGNGDLGKIQINPEEWPVLRETIDRMIGECK
mgnify:CR=1 FL=1